MDRWATSGGESIQAWLSAHVENVHQRYYVLTSTWQTTSKRMNTSEKRTSARWTPARRTSELRESTLQEAKRLPFKTVKQWTEIHRPTLPFQVFTFKDLNVIAWIYNHCHIFYLQKLKHWHTHKDKLKTAFTLLDGVIRWSALCAPLCFP